MGLTTLGFLCRDIGSKRVLTVMAKVGEPVSAILVWDWRVAAGILVKSVHFAESGNGYFGASCAAAGGRFLEKEHLPTRRSFGLFVNQLRMSLGKLRYGVR